MTRQREEMVMRGIRVQLLIVVAGAVVFAASGYTDAAGPQASSSRPESPTHSPQRAVLDQYCVSCHNEKLKTAGLMLDATDVANVSENPAVWEKVARKLRTSAMPPAGSRRPDQATYEAMASYLEAELDRAAAARPNPGRGSPFHRLSRTEYQNAIRDLLALDILPKEMDIALLLPADNSSSGFDNLADLLFVSPTLMERYLSAARKISRLAVGDPSIPRLVDIYRLPQELPQDVRVDGAPFGTRGGIVIRSAYPLDGEYLLKIELGGRPREPDQLEVSVDGQRMKLFRLGHKLPSQNPATVGEYEPPEKLEVRLPLKAGPQVIAVTFVQHTSALSEVMVRPRLRGRGEQLALHAVTITGPYDAKAAPDTPSRRRIFVCRPTAAGEEERCAKEILSTLARRAYRRPVTDGDVQTLLTFYKAGRAEGGFDTGIGRALERLLVSPQFLFRLEPHAGPADSVARITDIELASRLSFFLWSSIPDDQLLDLAAKGKLKDPAVLEQQVRRMLADVRSQALVNNFAEQWLFLRDIEARKPDDKLFPDFDVSLRDAFRRETELFLASILREDRSVLDLLNANYTFINERLAKHYGIPNVYGSYFRRVTLSDGNRRGLLGHGSILTLTSYATRTSPVLRGKYVLENILGAPSPPPPPNVPALRTESSGTGKPLSMREATVQHRANPNCAACHARMDPLGFALENFDAVGRWRTISEAGAPIDNSGVLPDGTKFDGVAGLRTILLRQPRQFVINVIEKLLTYALGRSVEYYDAPAVRTIVREAAQHDYRFSSLVLAIVKSTPFQMRKSDLSPPAGASVSLP